MNPFAWLANKFGGSPKPGNLPDRLTTHLYSLPSPRDKDDKRLLKDIATIGWRGQHVLGEGPLPYFSYTMGFYYSFGHPELFIMGMPPKLAHEIFNVAIQWIGEHGSLQDGQDCPGLLVGYSCRIIAVPAVAYPQYFGWATWLYKNLKSTVFPVLQIVWPDRGGLFPGERGYRSSEQWVLADLGDWPFPNLPPNLAVFTTKAVSGGEWIARVSHDAEGDWQFHNLGGPSNEEEPQLVSLAFILKLEPRIAELAHLPKGSWASRSSPTSPWVER